MYQLNLRETLVAYSSIDATTASVAMAISDKDVLAARKILIVSTALQGVSFGIQGAVISQLSRFDRSCLSQIPHPCFDSSVTALWAFWAVRILSALSPISTACRLSKRLHEVEHAPRDGIQVKEARTWLSLPSTLFSNYLIFLSTLFVQGFPALIVVHDSLSRSWKTLWTEWGQSAALIVAVAAIAHVVYSFTRLFRREAVEHRKKICQATNSNDEQAYRYTIPLSWSLLDNIRSRSPFCKIELHSMDELLIDDSELDTYSQAQIRLTKEERDRLWEELLIAFRLNDKIGVKDCLKRGVSMDRKDQHGEHPIHMAARLGDVSILKQTHLPGSLERLFSTNNAGQTPLQVAFLANQMEATKWIFGLAVSLWDHRDLEDMARKDIYELAKKSIDADNGVILEAIVERLPEWEQKTLGDTNGWSHGFFITALLRGRTNLADLLLARSIQPFKPVGSDLRRFYHPGHGSQLHELLVRHAPHILDTKPLGIDKCSTSFSLDHIVRQTLENGDERVITSLISSTLPLPAYFIDAVYTFPELTPSGGAMHDLLQRGALNWSKFRADLKDANIEEVKKHINMETNTGNCVRMLQVSGIYHSTALGEVLGSKRYDHSYSTTMNLLRLMRKNDASIQIHIESFGVPFRDVSDWADSAKQVIVDIGFQQEARDCTPGLCIWYICDIICDIIIDTCTILQSREMLYWLLQCLELILQRGPKAYVERRYYPKRYSFGIPPERGIIHSPLQMLSEELKEYARPKVILPPAPEYIFLLEEATGLLKAWEDFYKGRRTTRPSSAEHPEWESFVWNNTDE